MEKKYFLYLDESGKFQDDIAGKNSKPSIVGGYIIEEQSMTNEAATQLLKKVKDSSPEFANIDIVTYHGMESINDINGNFVCNLIERLNARNIKLVRFSNQKSLKIVNADITYLNILTEGIIELLKSLINTCLPDDIINLRVRFARRKYTDTPEEIKNEPIIQTDEYILRLQEKLILQFAKLPQNIQRRCMLPIIIEAGSAKREPCLMLADAACYALRGGISTINKDGKQKVKAALKYDYKVLEKNIWSNIKDLLASGAIAHAIYNWYTWTDKDLNNYKSTFVDSIYSNLKIINSESRTIQYSILSQMIKELVGQEQYKIVNLMLDGICKDFDKLIPKNAEAKLGNCDALFLFDLYFHRLTTATHQGDFLKAEQCILTCRNLLQTIQLNCENIDYILNYKLREVEHFKNIFDFNEALKILDYLKDVAENRVALLTLVCVDSGITDNLRSEILGKILSSRVQVYTYLLQNEPNFINDARVDILNSIEQFNNINCSRQYMYASQMEYYATNFNEAYNWLSKCYQPSATPDELLKEMFADTKYNSFPIMHYCALMARALKAEHPLGSEMYDAWVKNRGLDYIDKFDEYPYTNTAFYIATCKALKGEKTAEAYYTKATNSFLCNLTTSSDFTSFASGLAVLMEQFGYSDPKTESIKFSKLKNTYEKFLLTNPPQSLLNYFDGWDQVINHDKNDLTKIKSIALKLSNRIPIL